MSDPVDQLLATMDEYKALLLEHFPDQPVNTVTKGLLPGYVIIGDRATLLKAVEVMPYGVGHDEETSVPIYLQLTGSQELIPRDQVKHLPIRYRSRIKVADATPERLAQLQEDLGGWLTLTGLGKVRLVEFFPTPDGSGDYIVTVEQPTN